MLESDNYSDFYLQSALKKKIRSLPLQKRMLLKSTEYCGDGVVPVSGHRAAVFLLAGEDKADFFALNSCKSPWICPYCTHRRMAKYAVDISCAIDALKEKGQSAFMLTLTLPHHKFNSVEESTEILYKSWSDFIVRGNKNRTGKRKTTDVFASFCEQFNCKHRVRVAEYTYGKSGWHPHFHCLFWVDDKHFDKVMDWQDAFEERWTAILKKNMRKWLLKHNDKYIKNTDADKEAVYYRVENVFKYCDTGSHPAYISRDENGKAVRQQSSHYICGWGADKELTGNYHDKATAEGHYSPFQLLRKAISDNDDNLFDAFIDYAVAVRKHNHARINFSTHSGIRAIIKNWKNSVGFKEVLKKKKYDQMEVLLWFTKEQWSEISHYNRYFPMKDNIIYLATCKDAKNLIYYYLSLYDILLEDYQLNAQHTLTNLINEIFDHAA